MNEILKKIDLSQFYVRVSHKNAEIGKTFDQDRFTQHFGRDAAQKYIRYGEIISQRNQGRHSRELHKLKVELIKVTGIDPLQIWRSRRKTTRVQHIG